MQTPIQNLKSAKQRIALNFLVIGLGVGCLFMPYILLHLGLGSVATLSQLVFYPAAFYVAGLGVAGVIENGIRMARLLRGTADNLTQGPRPRPAGAPV